MLRFTANCGMRQAWSSARYRIILVEYSSTYREKWKTVVRRTSLILSEIFAGLLFGIVALGGLVAWRLHTGPVDLEFLTPHLEEALKTEGRGYEVDIEKTEAIWAGWANAVDIVATNVVVTAPDGLTLARIPQLSLGLSVRALLRGNLAPTSFDVIGPSIRVIRRENGEFALDFIAVGGDQTPLTPESGPNADPAPGRAVVDFLAGEMMIDPDPDHPFSFLRRISIIDGQVVFEDRVAGRYFRSPSAEIALFKRETGLQGIARLNLQYENRQADFTVRTGLRKGSLDYDATLEFHDVEPAAFATSLPPQLARITALSMPLSGNVSLSGRLRGQLEKFDFDLVGGTGKLDLIELYREPLNVNSLRLQGNASADFSTVRIDQAIVDLGDVTAYAEASMVPLGDDGSVLASLSAHMEDFDMRELHRFWPVSAQPGARRWVTENIYEGIVEEGTIDLALRLGGEDGGVGIEKLEGTLVYHDLGISYFETMTPIVGINGAGTFDRNGFYLGAQQASLADDIAVSGGQVDVVNLGQKGKQRLIIDARAEGPVVSVLKVLDEDPLNYGSKLGFDPAELSGDSVADLHFELPLVKGLTGDMLEVKAKGSLAGVSVPHGPFNLAVSEGALRLDVTRASMGIEGDVLLNGVPAEIVWNENFKPGAPFKRRFDVRATPGDAQRLALGLPDLSYWVEGAAPTELTYTVAAGKAPALSVRSDLSPALVRVAEAAWIKPPGEAGTLEIDARVLKKGNLIFDRLQVRTADTDGRVKIEFLPDMSDIARVTLQDVRYRGNDVKGTIARMDNGGYRIEVEGNRNDVRHFLNDDYVKASAEASGDAKEQGKRGKPLSISASFKEAITGENRRMYSGAFSGIYDGLNWEAMGLYATLGEGGNLELSYGKGEQGYELLVKSSDAGQALRSLGWWDEIQGGSMVIEGRRETIDGPLVGNIWVNDFRMKEAPAGVKLLQIITLVGLPAAAAAGEGVSFAGLEGSYVYHNDLLTFGEMEAWGPVGVHVDRGSWMDFKKNAIEMRGVVVPANTLQKLLGFIPFVGIIVQEGLIAANFTVSGKLDSPNVEGHPGSVPAIGFLRKLFRLKEAPDNGDSGEKPGAEPPTPRD